jgi:glycosyltransferase involved in cell wall biosynthesis
MRIGMITGEYPPMLGGLGAYTQRLSEQFCADGHEVHILTMQGSQQTPPRATVSANISRWGWHSIKQVQAWQAEQQLDVVSLQFQTAAYQMSAWVHLLPRFTASGTPFVTTFHDLREPYLFPKAGKFRQTIVNYLARQSDGIILTNQEDAITMTWHPNNQLIPIGSNIVPNPTASQAFHPNHTWDAQDFELVFFGFVNQTKGLDILLESLAELRQQGIPAKLTIAGDRTGSTDATNIAFSQTIDALIQEHNLTEHVHWTGFADDEVIGHYLEKADAVVLPFRDGASYRRGTLMAAIQHEAVIVTTCPQVQIPNFVHGENMLLVPPNNVTDLTAALHGLYNNAPLAAKLRQGIDGLYQHFRWDHIADKHIQFFEHLMERSKA